MLHRKREKKYYGLTVDGHKRTVVLGLQHIGHAKESLKWPETRVITHEKKQLLYKDTGKNKSSASLLHSDDKYRIMLPLNPLF